MILLFIGFMAGSFAGMMLTAIVVAGKQSDERIKRTDAVPMWFLEKWFGGDYYNLTNLQMEWEKECRK